MLKIRCTGGAERNGAASPGVRHYHRIVAKAIQCLADDRRVHVQGRRHRQLGRDRCDAIFAEFSAH